LPVEPVGAVATISPKVGDRGSASTTAMKSLPCPLASRVQT